MSHQRLPWEAAQQPAWALFIPLAMLLPGQYTGEFLLTPKPGEMNLLEAFKSLFSKQ